MATDARILYVLEPNNAPAKAFVHSLRDALVDWNITITTAGLTTLLFDIRKCNLAHLFLPTSSKTASLLKKVAGKTKLVQTILVPPEKPEDYRSVLLGDRIIVFSQNEKSSIAKHVPSSVVEVIPPCVSLPPATSLQPSSLIREKVQVGDNLMVVSLDDISTKQSFETALYISREYSRRGGFRFLIPRFSRDKDTARLRKELKAIAETEKLTRTTLFDTDSDFDSLLDSTDIAVYLSKDKDKRFDFPLNVLKAVSLGKPVLCYDIPPMNEAIKDFKPQWLCKNAEDFVRESRDIKKEANRLEEISTEFARFSRARFSPEQAASCHSKLYEVLLGR